MVVKKYSQESYGFTSHSELPKKHRCATSIFVCADNPFPFYFSIQMDPHPCRQAGQRFRRRPHFLANSPPLRQMTHSLGSFSSHSDGSYKDLRTFAASLLFILAHCLDPHHGDNMTDIDQSVLACSHTFNVHSSSPHSLSQSNTCVCVISLYV